MVMGTDAAHVLDAAARQSERGALTRRRGARVLGAWGEAWGWLTSERSAAGLCTSVAFGVERAQQRPIFGKLIAVCERGAIILGLMTWAHA